MLVQFVRRLVALPGEQLSDMPRAVSGATANQGGEKKVVGHGGDVAAEPGDVVGVAAQSAGRGESYICM